MNRYILTIAAMGYTLVLQVVDTDGDAPPVPANEPNAGWRNMTGDVTAQPGMKMEFGPGGWIFTMTTPAEQQAILKDRMQQRFDDATRWLTFNPLQYKLDLGSATPAEEAALIAYKQYVIAISDVKNQSGSLIDINWPVAPF